MRLLVLSDKESNYLWDSENPKRLEDIDLILSCGDLRPEYLSFIATFPCSGSLCARKSR